MCSYEYGYCDLHHVEYIYGCSFCEAEAKNEHEQDADAKMVKELTDYMEQMHISTDGDAGLFFQGVEKGIVSAQKDHNVTHYPAERSGRSRWTWVCAAVKKNLGLKYTDAEAETDDEATVRYYDQMVDVLCHLADTTNQSERSS